MSEPRFSRRFLLGASAALAFDAVTKAYAERPLAKLLEISKYECVKSDFEAAKQPIELEFKRVEDAESVILAKKNEKDVELVDFFADESIKQGRRQRNAGKETYVMSTITANDLTTENLWNCPGAIFVGKDIEIGREVAFLTHQNPTEILYGSKGKFLSDLDAQLREFLQSTQEGSVTYTLFGGNYFHVRTGGEKKHPSNDVLHSEHYVRSILLIAHAIQKHLPKLEPRVILGPNIRPSPVHARFRTQKRKLTIFSEENLPKGFSVCEFSEYLKELEKKVR